MSRTSSQRTTRSMKSHPRMITLQDKDHLILLNVEYILFQSATSYRPSNRLVTTKQKPTGFSASEKILLFSSLFLQINWIYQFHNTLPHFSYVSVKDPWPLVRTTMAERTYDWLATDRVLAGAHTLGRSLRVHIPLSQCHLSFRWSDRGKDNVVSEVSP